VDRVKKLFLDIETAPSVVYVWGLFNQNVQLNQIVAPGYTLCWAAKWDHDKKIMFSSVQDGEREMVEKIYNLLEEADVVIHYNGKKFDIPILNSEFVKLGLDPPSSYRHIDLLKTARAQFRFTSNKLDFVAQHLGVGAKTEHKGMKLWSECMAGCPKSWRQMKRYNIQDVRLLPKLYKKLLPWIKDHPNYALYLNENKPVCTNCGSAHVISKGVERTLTQTYRRFKCRACGTPLRARTTSVPADQRGNILTQSK
jgi:hypothetical protein